MKASKGKVAEKEPNGKFHIEPDGGITLIIAPKVDKFPVEFDFPEAKIGTQIEVDKTG